MSASPLGLGGAGSGLGSSSLLSGLGPTDGFSGMSGLSGMGGMPGVSGLSGMGGMPGMGGSGGILGMLLQMMQMICSMLMMFLGGGMGGMLGGGAGGMGDPTGGMGGGSGGGGYDPTGGAGGGAGGSAGPGGGSAPSGGSSPFAPGDNLTNQTTGQNFTVGPDGSYQPSQPGGGGGGSSSPGSSSGAPTPTTGTPTPSTGNPTPSTGNPTPSGGNPSPTCSTTGSSNAPSSYPGSGKVQWDKAPAFLKKWQSQIEAASQKTGMPESLLAAMITDESSGNNDAVTTNQDPTHQGDDAKDVGLMQVDGKTYKDEIQPKHPDLPKDQMARYKADVNVLAGAYYVKDLPFDSWAAKLRAYNSGPAHVDPSNPDSIKPDSTGLAPGTQGYPTKIMNLASRLEAGTLNW